MKLTRRIFTGALIAALAGGVVMAQRGGGRGNAAGAPAAPAAEALDLPILGLAGVTFRTSNPEKARQYYQNVLGLAEAFTLKDANGNVSSIFFKINDDQYVEAVYGLKPSELRRLARVMVQSSDLPKLHQIFTERGVNPSPIRTGPDGNPVFRVAAPNDHNIDFIQYVPGSQQTLARGKFLSPNRLSTHLWHVGLMMTDREAVAPFWAKLGIPGGRLPRNESIDTPGGDSNTDSKYPLLDRNNPDQLEQWTRENDGAANHMALEIADMRKARDLAQQRGGYTDLQVRAQVGGSRHWLVHLFDAEGSRTELMESAFQDPAVLPSRTIMAPGPPAPPILPREGSRGFPWP